MDNLQLAKLYDDAGCYKEAISYYESALEKYPDDYKIYGNLARLYAEVYSFKEKDRQLYYSEKAWELSKDDVSLMNLALTYTKYGYFDAAEKLYDEIEKRNIQIPKIQFAIGAYRIKNGDFSGYLPFRARFDYDLTILPKNLDRSKLWQPGDDLKDKTLWVGFEQGYGDAIMFIRFVKDTIPLCKKLFVTVPKAIYDLCKSNFDFEIYPDTEKLDYDVFIPMMDLIILLNIQSNNIPYKDAYLHVENDRYTFHTNKFKVGLCLASVNDSTVPYRSIPVRKLHQIFQIPDIEFFNFQKGRMDTEDYPVVQLGQTFRDFTDTAKALSAMDLVISTDNVILNLAGALGIKTFGLFNLHTDCRWFYLKENVGWYNSVKPFQCLERDKWEYPVQKLKEELLKLKYNNSEV